MPIYEYRCKQCGELTTQFRRIAESSAPASCEFCGETAERIISAPHLNVMRAGLRKAHQVNERSAHEPKVRQKHVCSSVCQHSHTTESNKPLLKQPTTRKRPWMLGH